MKPALNCNVNSKINDDVTTLMENQSNSMKYQTFYETSSHSSNYNRPLIVTGV